VPDGHLPDGNRLERLLGVEHQLPVDADLRQARI
jgi:hypothetical protein